ncbi:hypothetical protein A4D02_34255 [Niastella koreensis]|uniref:Uncharacterized protein n=1 Tax=Niastella koreensis TaxID=354356 RepID=A0ABX3NWT6_9BACT|nr:hypothetical protein [Niastella koreensis]OQP45233.1 hypothetical protein A4D02_34255 [Niastella koreensis]
MYDNSDNIAQTLINTHTSAAHTQPTVEFGTNSRSEDVDLPVISLNLPPEHMSMVYHRALRLLDRKYHVAGRKYALKAILIENFKNAYSEIKVMGAPGIKCVQVIVSLASSFFIPCPAEL